MLSKILSNNKNFIIHTKSCRYISSAIRNVEDYNEKPVYPPILDRSYKAKKIREYDSWHDKIKKLKTIEEKLLELNMPKYYGYKCIMLNDNKFPYNTLPLMQYSTKTNFNEVDSLPDFYSQNNNKVDNFLSNIKSDIEDAICFEYTGYARKLEFKSQAISPEEKEQKVTSDVISQINRVLINALSADNDHLNNIEVDLDPRHEAFWFVSGIKPPALVRKIREGVSWQKEFANDPVDRPFQYLGKPYLALRHNLPLEPIKDLVVEEQNRIVQNIEIPEFRYDPRSLGYLTTHRHGTTVPGFWPGSKHEFGLLSYQKRSHLINRHTYCHLDDNQDALHAEGILTSFAWLFGQACYQGFTTFNDMTYPLSTQTVITDGKHFSFYVYQMNTSSHQANSENRFNECWGTKETKLFEEIDSKTGKIVGFNDDVLRNLIHFYINSPKERQHALKPYLDAREWKISDISHTEKRDFLEKQYKHMVANRPRSRLLPETYLWEKIYKIDHDTKPLVAKRRPFELGINPYKRRMDEHARKYIPKVIRPGGPKSKDKFEKTYYP